MKTYEVTEQTINAIAQVLHNLDVGSKTLSGIVDALKKKEIVKEEKKEA
jgi:hypothetical protein